MKKPIDMYYAMRMGFSPQEGQRYSHELAPADAGTLFTTDPDHPEPVVLLGEGDSIYWRVRDDYLASLPLFGRPFVHGVMDCYTFLSDYLGQTYGITLPVVEYEDGWWRKGKSLYQQHIEEAGMVWKVPPLLPGDVLGMAVFANTINHTAAYIGDGKIAHHMAGQLSTIEPLRPAHLRFVRGYYRHKDMP